MKPLELPEPCPICGKKVFVTEVGEWESETRKPISISIECEAEPDIESDEWEEWHNWHYSMPYVDWLPYEIQAVEWLRREFVYIGGELREESAKCAHCENPATCYGKYADCDEGYACDECCGHGCEDGHCVRFTGGDS